jgi:Fic family protein
MQGPPPPDVVADALKEWESFIHSEIDLPVLIKIGLAHSQFETIHPFLDGNGRLGRLLITFILTEKGILQKPFLYLSHYFKQHRQEYYTLLQNVRDKGDWESWLEFFLNGITTVSNESVETIRKILKLREDHRLLITNHLGRKTANGHKLLEHLYQRPIITVNQIQEITGTTFTAANELIKQFVELELLRR